VPQATPPLHPTLTEDYPDEAKEFFDIDARKRIAERLFKGHPVSSAVEAGLLDRIAVVCWLYAHDGNFIHEAAVIQRRNAKRILKAARDLDRALELADRDTSRRVSMALGDRPRAPNWHADEDEQRSHRDRRYLMGSIKLGIFWTKLEAIIHACALAYEPDTPSTKNAGRKAQKTPRIIRDLCHVLANIWCEMRQVQFIAPSGKTLEKYEKEAHNGAKFLSQVLDELCSVLAKQGQSLPENLDRVRLYIEVRDERKDAGKLSAEIRKANARAAESRNMRSRDWYVGQTA
jgi:hypothetical protein